MKNALQIAISAQQTPLAMFAQVATIRTPLKNVSSAQASSLIASSATIRSASNARTILFMWQILENASHAIQQIIIAQLAAVLLTVLLASLTHIFPVEFAKNAVSLVQAASLVKLLQSLPLPSARLAVKIII